VATLPGNLDQAVDRDLEGRERHQALRRIGLGVLGLVVLAALFNVFGQTSSTATAEGAAATLSLRAPSSIRGGVIFEARFQIQAHDDIAHPAIVLAPGWLNGTTLNSLEPAPTTERSGPDGLELDYPPQEAGDELTVWTQWQTNPTDVGRRPAGVELRDGDRVLAHIDRTVTSFP
jgi:hypothetical protein